MLEAFEHVGKVDKEVASKNDELKTSNDFFVEKVQYLEKFHVHRVVF